MPEPLDTTKPCPMCSAVDWAGPLALTLLGGDPDSDGDAHSGLPVLMARCRACNFLRLHYAPDEAAEA